MSPSGAASGVKAPSLSTLLVWLLALASVGAATAAPPPAQGTPMVMVDAFEYGLGDTLTVRGSGLEPGADYVVTLTSPAGEATETTVAATQTGTLTSRTVLDEAGAWTVALSGPRVTARLGVRVVGASAEGPAPEDDGEPEEGRTPEAEAEPEEQAPEGGAGAAEQEGEPGAAEQAGEPGAAEQEGEAGAAEPRGEPEDAAPGQGDEELPGSEAPGGQRDGLPGESVPPPAQARAAIEVAIDRGDVVGRRSGVEAWRLTFGANSGETAGLLVRDETALVGHGNHLLQVDRLTGAVLRRERLPAQVTDVSEGEEGLVVTVRYSRGEEVALPWPPQRPLAFDPDPALYSWLRAEAGVPDPAAQLSRDPTNPWLYVAAARQRPDSADTLRRSALGQARTFYELAQLAQELMAGPQRDADLATEAMLEALRDFTARGYRASLLLEPDLVDAYGFPQVGLRQALTSGDREAADFWAGWVHQLAGDGLPDAGALLGEYAAALQDAGDAEAASVWRERAAAVGGADPMTTLERAAAAVGSTGWYGVTALLVAVLALHLTLVAKYWRAQTLTLRQRRESGRATSPVSRAFTLRYATFTEKLVVLLLFAAMVAVAALSGWVDATDGLPAELGSGSLATPTSVALLQRAADNPDRAFALAFAAQSAGDDETATALYRELLNDADAMNNLGVLRGDPELFRLALDIEPRHPEASFNLGEAANPSRLMQSFQPDAPLLAAPDQGRLTRAFGGSPWAALGAAFTNPFTALDDLRPFETRWLWTAVVVLFLAWVAWTVLSLFFPRPQAARNAPRTFVYHLLALLLPGSGLADELWGVLLLVPWAIFGTDLLRHLGYLPGAPALAYDTDLIALVAIYVVNTVAFAVEFSSYRRRMRDLATEHPELAAAYGLRP